MTEEEMQDEIDQLNATVYYFKLRLEVAEAEVARLKQENTNLDATLIWEKGQAKLALDRFTHVEEVLEDLINSARTISTLASR